jgi:hypothetical protein
MEYTVLFDFNVINKKSMVSGKSGEVDITADATPEQLKNSSELIRLIALDIEKKTKQSVISVDIKEVLVK